MQAVTIKIKESAFDKVMYLLDHLKDDVQIIEKHEFDLEIINKENSDYKYILDGRKRRDNGEKTYSINEVLKDYK
jgi:hypothetical protein